MTAVPRPDRAVTPAFEKAATASPKKRTALSPLTLRLTWEERERLEDLAAGMTLSAYVRACVFAEDVKLRKTRPADAVEDKKAAAEALALLGQSRIASNLNQLAYHANIGALIVGEAEKADIAEANAHLAAIRTLLMDALGKKTRRSAGGRRQA
ncbi:plasmid mobilization protein [Shimia sp. MMG029]|uniref:plasmid mobilization protein n=1 Tax=Shimia sp. MMG029 TaxID=3021978 RepID=UPI0022FDC79F|nr:plasmid mobilization relaxosome protein MobC [Shimia sp. MMG029]MDA5558164.1 plasmid mobilization relaxosome protein MobC [Shimia sp. MMG029]